MSSCLPLSGWSMPFAPNICYTCLVGSSHRDVAMALMWVSNIEPLHLKQTLHTNHQDKYSYWREIERFILNEVFSEEHVSDDKYLSMWTSNHYQGCFKMKGWKHWGMHKSTNFAVSKHIWELSLQPSRRKRRRSSMTERFAYEKRYVYGRKAPVPATCDAVEALLRHEFVRT